MKTTAFLPVQPMVDSPTTPEPTPNSSLIISNSSLSPGQSIRHILLGEPDAIRQTIHLLHTLHYAETVLWSPVLTVEKPLVIRPEGGKAMSLLRRRL